MHCGGHANFRSVTLETICDSSQAVFFGLKSAGSRDMRNIRLPRSTTSEKSVIGLDPLNAGFLSYWPSADWR
jgi:hypothetical protein